MIALGADHGGFKLKEEIKKYLDEKEIKYKDFGCFNEERTDYPIYAEKVSKAIQGKECNLGILICKSGAGMTIAANIAINEDMARNSKADDDINVLAIPAEYLSVSQVIAIIRVWIATDFKNDDRYLSRLQMIENIEEKEMK